MKAGSSFALSRDSNDTSVMLDLSRAVAAQMVCIGHGITFFMPQFRYEHLPLMQNVGVLLFFALSGFVIAFTLVERSLDPAYGFGRFMVERIARIYSGLIPCLLVIAAVDAISVHVDHTGTIAPTRTVPNFLANLFMFENYRGPFDQFLQWPIFGSATPIWSLVLEWHIYLFAGAVFFVIARPRSAPLMIPIAVIFAGMPLHFAFDAAQPDGLGRCLFLLWLGGACVFLLLRDCRHFAPAWLSFALAVAAAAVFVARTDAHGEYDPAGYPLIVLMLLGIACAGQRSRLIVSSPYAASVIRFVAGYSFTLYLLHHTLMLPLFLLWPDAGWAAFLPAVIGANVLAAAIAVVTEMRHKDVARLLLWMPDRLRAVVSRERPQNN